jgi:hypothetical protein
VEVNAARRMMQVPGCSGQVLAALVFARLHGAPEGSGD